MLKILRLCAIKLCCVSFLLQKYRSSSARFYAFCGIVSLCVMLPLSALAAEISVTNEEEETTTWELDADKVVAHSDSNILEAFGSVVLSSGDNYVKADYIRYYGDSDWCYLKDHVEARLGADRMNGSEAEFDLKNRTGWLKDGTIFVEEPNTYLSGERIEKLYGDMYSFRNMKLTTCDGATPAWSIKADEGTLEIGGYAVLRNVFVQVADNSVAYLPLGGFPVKGERQTGLLMPEFGSSSKRGYYYNQPFFWAIDESSDLMYNAYWMETRGIMQGVQYRYLGENNVKSWWRADYLQDGKTYTSSNSDYDASPGDGLIRNNPERFWLRGMYDGYLFDPAWEFKATLDYTSDQDYLREFDAGFSGYNQNNEDLDEWFGRSLAPASENRISQFLVNRDWDLAGVALSSKFTQNVGMGHGNFTAEENRIVQTLPQLDAYLFRTNLLPEASLPLEFQANLQATHFTREQGTQGSRFEVYPKVSVPFVSDYASLLGTVGVRQTQYSFSKKEDDGQQFGATGYDNARTLVTVDLDASTEIARRFSFASSEKLSAGDSRWVALRHAVQPRLSYSYISDDEQDDNPYFISEDRVDKKNEIGFELGNLFSYKKENAIERTDGTIVNNLAYNDFLRVFLRQGYDFNEATRTDARDKYERRPFTDTELEVRVNALDWLSLTNKSFWSPYLGSMTRHEHSLSMWYDDRVRVATRFDFRQPIDEYKRNKDIREHFNASRNLNTMSNDIYVKLWGAWNLTSEYNVDLDDGSTTMFSSQLLYSHQCYEVSLSYKDDGYDYDISMRITFPGLSF